MNTVAARTKKIIADTLGVEEHKITPETDLVKDLDADSLDVVELIVILEKEFKVTIPDDKADRIRKVHQLIDYFEIATAPVETYIKKAA